MDNLTIESLISDLALILVLGAIATVLFKTLKQPVVLGYIVAGFIASPHFSMFPSVASTENIEFWANIGIIMLLFSLGLEFSFKKLLNVGGSATVTALIIVTGMMGLGFLVGKLIGLESDDGLFLGGMLSMSSTTIILKALTDLGMRKRRFVPMIFAVLIVEDLFAVLMMVLLSSIAINKTVQGNEMLASIIKLTFFILIWFAVGIFLLPTLFKRFSRVINDEMLLVISMGLCFLMVVFSVKSGFSRELGAFVMGSILAGTVEAERIERLMTPIKDLFGAVFFISVGMMVDPAVIIANAGTIALLSVVVIVGMIVFGTFGMVATGQPLRVAVQSGFALTQIGEFSFIIATLGMSLGVLEASIYPIIVAVSVVTIFTTPFFIKSADGFYDRLERMLPASWTSLLNGYSKNASQTEENQVRKAWKSIIGRYVLRLLIYSVILLSIVTLSLYYIEPLLVNIFGKTWAKWIGAAGTIVVISPFLFGIIMAGLRKKDRKQLYKLSGNVSLVPIVIMILLSSLVVFTVLMTILYHYGISSLLSVAVAMGAIALLAIAFAPVFFKRIRDMEQRFIGNANVRENRRTGRGVNLVSDLHVAYMTVGHDCPFVGEKLKDAKLRSRYGINLVNIQRAGRLYPVPTGEMRIFPGDIMGIIGNDEQIQRMLPLVEGKGDTPEAVVSTAEFTHFAISANSPLVGRQLANARLREDYESLLVAVEREKGEFITPTPKLTFAAGDVLWIVGDPKRLTELR